MAILKPSDDEVAALAPEHPIMVDSDAEDNAHAILEIERWCRERGLVREQAIWLRTVMTPEGTMVRRGVCFRPSEEWIVRRRDAFDETVRVVSVSPMTISSVDILDQG